MNMAIKTSSLRQPWEATKAALDLTRVPDEASGEEVRLLLERSKKYPPILYQALVYLVETQHPYLSSRVFATELEDYTVGLEGTKEFEDIRETMWNSMVTQEWEDPLVIANFVQWMAPAEHGFLTANAWLDVLDKYPQLIEKMQDNMVWVGRECQYNEGPKEAMIYFERAKKMLLNCAKRYLGLHLDMDQPLVLDDFARVAPGGRFYFDDVLAAYNKMPAAQRDTHEGLVCFARMLMNVKDMDASLYGNDYLNPRVADILEHHPNGAIGRLIGLHACCRAFFPQFCDDVQIRKFERMFQCNPTKSDDFPILLDTYAPEYKDFFSIMRGLGLDRDEVWEQALARTVMPVTADFAVSSGMFSTVS